LAAQGVAHHDRKFSVAAITFLHKAGVGHQAVLPALFDGDNQGLLTLVVSARGDVSMACQRGHAQSG